jgi:membrane protease YdiL (CAAX protease family)
MRTCLYTPYHAMAAFAVIIFAIKDNFWQTFIHGLPVSHPKPGVLLFALFCQTALFGSLSLVLWASTRFPRRKVPSAPSSISRKKALKTALIAALPVFAATLALMAGCTYVFETFLDVKLAPQNMLDWLQGGTYSLGIRLTLMAYALLAAPLLEEPLFRGIVYRGLASRWPDGIALAVQGFIFALVHVNAATFIPLWFLGAALAVLYRRTGTLLAPMCVHFLFNVLNLVLCLLFPGASL